MPEIPAPRKRRQEDQEFEASLCYIESSRTASHESLSHTKQPRNNRNKRQRSMYRWNGRHKVSLGRSASACPEPMVKCKLMPQLDARVSAGIHESQDATAVQQEQKECRINDRRYI